MLIESGLKVSAVLLALGLLACDGPDPVAPPPRPERIILIVVDTLRRDHVAPYAQDIATRGIERIAKRGMVFENAYASFSLTTPSTGALFTGSTPSLEGVSLSEPLTLAGRGWCGLLRYPGSTCLPEQIPTLAESLRDAGYATLGVVANPLLFDHGYERGFDTWIPVGRKTEALDYSETVANSRSRMAEHVNRRVLSALDELASDRFFLYIHYLDVHDYNVGRSGDKQTLYREAVIRFDEQLRALMRQLNRRAFDRRDTLMLLTADHGEALGAPSLFKTDGHRGNPALETMLEIPLIVAPAGPEDTSQLVRTEDIRRLIEARVGIETPARSPLGDDEQFIAEYTVQTYRRGPWKSVRRRRNGEHILLHLADDPGETRDVAGENPRVASEHLARMDSLTRALRAEPEAGDADLSEVETLRLRELGYIE